MAKEMATIGGGCFWCVEAVYDELKGIDDVVSGYAGGHVQNPNYRQVCAGDTGHAEVIRIIFDNEVISYREILDVFFAVHDPTTLNQQGPDVGTQYRSIILYHSPEQQQVAEEAIKAAQELWEKPIVTEVVPFKAFYPAEDYHQEYFANNPNQPYCKLVVQPKVNKFRSQYMERLKAPAHG